MLERCYSLKFQERNPTYVGCTVSSDWLLFSKFRAWVEGQDWEGKQLDKDILEVGNKVYSEEGCIFVSARLNSALTGYMTKKGKYPVGVSRHKGLLSYQASCKVGGKSKALGSFSTVDEAEIAYCKTKYQVIDGLSNQPEAASQPRLQEGLLRHAKVFSDRAEELTVQLK